MEVRTEIYSVVFTQVNYFMNLILKLNVPSLVAILALVVLIADEYVMLTLNNRRH